jgi:hypothetical protein
LVSFTSRAARRDLHISVETEKWGRVVKFAGIKPE